MVTQTFLKGDIVKITTTWELWIVNSIDNFWNIKIHKKSGQFTNITEPNILEPIPKEEIEEAQRAFKNFSEFSWWEWFCIQQEDVEDAEEKVNNYDNLISYKFIIVWILWIILIVIIFYFVDFIKWIQKTNEPLRLRTLEIERLVEMNNDEFWLQAEYKEKEMEFNKKFEWSKKVVIKNEDRIKTLKEEIFKIIAGEQLSNTWITKK